MFKKKKTSINTDPDWMEWDADNEDLWEGTASTIYTRYLSHSSPPSFLRLLSSPLLFLPQLLGLYSIQLRFLRIDGLLASIASCCRGEQTWDVCIMIAPRHTKQDNSFNLFNLSTCSRSYDLSPGCILLLDRQEFGIQLRYQCLVGQLQVRDPELVLHPYVLDWGGSGLVEGKNDCTSWRGGARDQISNS